MEAVIYNALRNGIVQIAAGDRESSEFEMSLTDMGYEQMSWTAADLNLDTLKDGGNPSEAAKEAVEQKLAFDFESIVNTLLVECPYELYWYDKTIGAGYSGTRGYSVNYDGSRDDYVISVTGTVHFAFAVDQAYSAGAYLVNTEAVNRAKTAKANAEAIAASCAGYSDYEKLVYYKNQICNLASYNNAAANGEVTDGNAWQLVWVFDGDESTEVVCEGYAKAFQYLCNLSSFPTGVRSCLVTGTMYGGTGEGLHMWNVVTMDDREHYLVDVTNCDAGTIGADDLLFLAGTAVGDVNTGYVFNCNGHSVTFSYDNDTKVYYGNDELKLAVNKYVEGSAGPVIEVLVSDIILDQSELNMTAGESVVLTATVLPENATNKRVLWSSSDEQDESSSS